MSKASRSTTRSTRSRPNNPVVLTHASGHASFVNGKAMQEAGITQRDEESFRRRDSERQERAIRPACCASARRAWWDAREAAYNAKRTPAETRRAAAANRSISPSDESLSKGITTFQDAGSPFSTVDVLKAMAEKHELRMRIWMMLRAGNDATGAAAGPVPHRSAPATITSPCAPSSAQIDGALGLARRVAARAVHR